MGKIVTFGNTKLADCIMCFSMAGHSTCPAKHMCKLPDECYYKKLERLYPNLKQFHERQMRFWLDNEPHYIATYLLLKVKRRLKPTRFFRYNVAGDLHGQSCVDKLNHVARLLKQADILTYGYSARSDLLYPAERSFVVRGSGWAGPDGMSIVIGKDDLPPQGFHLCPGSGCGSTCFYCLTTAYRKVAFHKH